MAATTATLRNALSRILGQDDSHAGRAFSSGQSPPAPPPSPSLQRSNDFEFEKLFHSPGSDYMESEPGSPSTSDCDLPCQPSSCSSLAVPLCCNHHAYHSSHHGNGLAPCICQISRQTEALSVSFPSDISHHHRLDHGSLPASSLGMTQLCRNLECAEEHHLEVGPPTQTEKRERKISLKRNHDDISMDDFRPSDPSWLVVEVDPMATGGYKKSCQERNCAHGGSRSSPKHGRRQPAIVSSVPSTSDFTHDHTLRHPNASHVNNAAANSGSYPHWPNGFSRPRAATDSGRIPVSSMGMSSAGVTRTTIGFDEQQMDCQDEDSRLPAEVVTRVDDMEFEESLPSSSGSPFSFSAQIPDVSSGPVCPVGSQPFASFRPHAHTFSAGFTTRANTGNSPHSPPLPPSGLMNVGMSHLGVPENNFTVPRTQQFDFFSFHEPSASGTSSSVQDSFSKSL